LRILTCASLLSLVAAAAAPAFAADAPAARKPAADAPKASQTQGTAWAVKQAVVAAPAAPVASPVATTPPVVAHGDLVETLRASGQFTTFLKAADATNLTGVLKNNQNLTLFAPTDAAFAALPAGQLDQLMADKTALQKRLAHHIINARVDSSKIKGAKGPVPSVAGDPIELDGSDETLRADNAVIVQADVVTSNGVLQVVNQVLTPGASSTGGAAAPASAAVADPPAQKPAAQTSTTHTTTVQKPAAKR
jgi:uncharacterized surface protein with fasciclin (FAS1) repeats